MKNIDFSGFFAFFRMVYSTNAFGKSFGVKTKKSYFYKFWKNAVFALRLFPAKQGWVTFLVFVVSCGLCKESKPKSASKMVTGMR